jgi:hypothetical protein
MPSVVVVVSPVEQQPTQPVQTGQRMGLHCVVSLPVFMPGQPGQHQAVSMMSCGERKHMFSVLHEGGRQVQQSSVPWAMAGQHLMLDTLSHVRVPGMLAGVHLAPVNPPTTLYG